MDVNVVAQLVKEGRGHPYTIAVLLLCCAGLFYTYTNSARAQVVQNIQAQLTTIKDVQADQHRQNLEAQLTAVETDLFNITETIRQLVAAHKPVEQIYLSRQNELTQARDKIKRQMPAQASP